MHLRIVLTNKAHNLRRVNGGELHFRVMPYTRHFDECEQDLAVLAPR